LDGAGLLDFAQQRCRLDGFDDDAVTGPLRVLLKRVRACMASRPLLPKWMHPCSADPLRRLAGLEE
jgi:hypothetical protein